MKKISLMLLTAVLCAGAIILAAGCNKPPTPPAAVTFSAGGNDHVVQTATETKHISTGQLVRHAGNPGLNYTLENDVITVGYTGTAYKLPYYLPADKAIYEEIEAGGAHYVIIGENATIAKGKTGANIGITLRNSKDETFTRFFDAHTIPTEGKTFDITWVHGGNKTYTVKLAAAIQISPAPVKFSQAVVDEVRGKRTTDTPVFEGNSANLGVKIKNNLTAETPALYNRFIGMQITEADFGAYTGTFKPNACFIANTDAPKHSFAVTEGNYDQLFDSEVASYAALFAGGKDAYMGVRFNNPDGEWFANETQATCTATVDIYAVAPAAAVTTGAAPKIYFGTTTLHFKLGATPS